MEGFKKQRDFGGNSYVIHARQLAVKNETFRTAIWTGSSEQMTLMCIPIGGEIGAEVHEETEQIIRVERGYAMVKMGKDRCLQDFCLCLKEGDVVFVPAGTWHNVINTGNFALKLSSIYAPPHHPKGTVDQTKEDSI